MNKYIITLLFLSSLFLKAQTGCGDPEDPNFYCNTAWDCGFEGLDANGAPIWTLPSGFIDDGSCMSYGCTDENALNYDPDAVNDDGSCEYAPWEVTPTDCNMTIALLGDVEIIVNGDAISDSIWLGVANADGFVSGMILFNPGENAGLTVWGDDSSTGDYDGMLAGEAFNWIASYNGVVGDADLDVSIEYACNGMEVVSSGSIFEVVLDQEILAGCTDALACNYMVEATFDDDSCDYSCVGCMDEGSCNYDSLATLDCSNLEAFDLEIEGMSYLGQFNNSSYYVPLDYNSSFSWQEAVDTSIALGGHLATITSEEEQTFIANALTDYNPELDYNCWIGLSDVEEENNWEWVSDEEYAYESFYIDQPDNWDNNEHFVELVPWWGWDWNDASLYVNGGVNGNGFILEMPICCTYSQEGFNCDGEELTYVPDSLLELHLDMVIEYANVLGTFDGVWESDWLANWESDNYVLTNPLSEMEAIGIPYPCYPDCGASLTGDLTGLEDCPNLNWLNISGNAFDSVNLNIVPNLTSLYVADCSNLMELDVSFLTELSVLAVYLDGLTEIDISNNTSLTSFNCHLNDLTELDISNNTVLTNLTCSYNNLSALNLSNNTVLTTLACSDNLISELDVSLNVLLDYLDCHDNNLSELNISNNTALTNLTCSFNNISDLDVSSNTQLYNLAVQGTNISQLDVSQNVELTYLDCSQNSLLSCIQVWDVDYAIANFIKDEDAIWSLDCGYDNGCTDPEACNYDLDAITDDGSCEYQEEGFNCDGEELTYVVDPVIEYVLEYAMANLYPDIDPYDWVADNYVLTSAISDIEAIYVGNPCLPNCGQDITGNLTGLEDCPMLTHLNAQGNSIDSLTLSSTPYLTELHLDNCAYLTEIDLSPVPNLQHYNQPLSTGSYVNGGLTTFDGSNTLELLTLNLANNDLIELNTSQNTELITLSIEKNNLTQLDVSNNTALTSLNCSDNPLSCIQVWDIDYAEANFIKDDEAIWSLDCSGWGCTDPLACNYNETAIDNDNSCIYIDVNSFCDFCSGETDGTGIIIDQDADDDGICDADDLCPYDQGNDADGDGVCSEEALTYVVDPVIEYVLEYAMANLYPDIDPYDWVADNYVLTSALSDIEAIYVGYPCLPDCSQDITGDLTGLEDCPMLTHLNAQGNSMDSLTLSSTPYLTELYLNNCTYLTEIDLSPVPYLQTYHQPGGGLITFDASSNLDLLNINISNNDLINLNISQNTALQQLAVQYNNLSELDVSNNTALTSLNCSNNSLLSCIQVWDVDYATTNFIKDEDAIWSLDCGYDNGCTDPEACNYDPDSTTDDYDSCQYPISDCVDCDGVFIDVNNNDIFDCDEVSGCMDPNACNYNAEASIDNDPESCQYVGEVCLNDSLSISVIPFINPGLEGNIGQGQTPDPWQNCMPFGFFIEPYGEYATPDTHPSDPPIYEIVLAPSEGESYVGFGEITPYDAIPGIDALQEGFTQELTFPMVAGIAHSFNIDLANGLTPDPWNSIGIETTVAEVKVFGGFDVCSETELLWESGPVTNENWETYNIEFVPNDNYSHISFVAFKADSTAACGYVLADNLSPILLDGVVIYDSNCECVVSSILGCTDPEAFNYNPEATVDDGSCFQPLELVPVNDTLCLNDTIIVEWSGGSPTDSIWIGLANSTQILLSLTLNESETAQGYTSNTGFYQWLISDEVEIDMNDTYFFIIQNATPDSQSSTNGTNGNQFSFEICDIEGCTDEIACNYHPLATIDDGSCTYIDFNLSIGSYNDLGEYLGLLNYNTYPNDSLYGNSCSELCDGSYYLTYPGSSSIEWNPEPNPDETGLCSGVYTLTITNAECEVSIDVVFNNNTYVCPSECDSDIDGDGICDNDDGDCDGDGIDNDDDPCPYNADDNCECDSDIDGDGICDSDDVDCDGDGISNDDDPCPYNSDDNCECDSDIDGDGICDFYDIDCDGDGINNDDDPCPYNSDDNCECDSDIDGDGICDSDDVDMDGDGVVDGNDDCPIDPDCDDDGVVDGDDDCPMDPDCDDDGLLDGDDDCPMNPDDNCECDSDIDGNGICDSDDVDMDGDGVVNGDDDCPMDSDCDDDGVLDGDDDCPMDPDCDDDGILDGDDDCLGDVDVDEDGICDEVDECVGDYDECGVCNGDGPIPYYDCDDNCLNDEDGDGICDELDNCVSISNFNQLDSDNDGVGDVCDCIAVSIDGPDLVCKGEIVIYNIVPNLSNNDYDWILSDNAIYVWQDNTLASIAIEWSEAGSGYIGIEQECLNGSAENTILDVTVLITESEECDEFSINEHADVKKIIKVVDVLGREVEKNTDQLMLLYIYDDGSVEKVLLK